MGGIFSPRAKSQAANTPAYTGLQLQTSSYGRVVPVVYGTNRIAPNLIWSGDFISTSHSSDAGGGGGKGGVGGGGGGKGGGGSVTYTYSTAVAMLLCEGPIAGVPNVYVDKNITSLSTLGFSLFTGSYPQSPWSYLTSKHPGQDLSYPGLAYVAAPNFQLGNSPNLPNHNFEISGVLSSSISGQVDADASQVIYDILTNPHYGAGFPSSKIGSLTDYQNYTVATGLWISPAYTDATAAASVLQDLAAATNSEFVWSSGQLRLVPYGDQTITANGHTYTPPSAALFDLTDDDFIAADGEDPVQLTRKRPADAFNAIQLEYTDRANFYNKAIAEAKDQAAIDSFGLRSAGNQTAAMFCDAGAVNKSAQLQLQRQSVRNAYTFTLDIRYIVLDPMDIVSLTDSNLGLNKQWVRITDITLNEDDTLTFIAEEYLAGTGSPALYSVQTNDGYNVNYNSSPGDVNAPVIFEAPVQIATTGLETWMAVSGGPIWGGCDVYVSSDDATYKLAGRITGNSRQGVLSADLPAGSDPDTTHTLSVNLSESRADLISGSQADADALTTLCYVDGELIAFQNATLTGTNAFDLTYLRRGNYNTGMGAHLAGSQFARLDGGIFKYSYDKSVIGQTIYVKFCSFNIWGGALQSLSDVTAYSHVVVGPPNPPNVTGFSGQQNGNVVSFAWDHVVDFALKGYDVGYAPQGETNWDNFEILSEVAAGTEMTNASVPPGTWTFGIRARDIADQLSPAAGMFDLVVTNENDSVLQQDQDPDWIDGRLPVYWDRLTQNQISPNTTVSRAGATGTRVNSSGFIEVIGADLPRFDYDPVSLAPRGLLIEEARTNLAIRSREFDNPAWNLNAAAVTANAAVSPDGTATADKITVNSANDAHGVYSASTFAIVDSSRYAVSVFAKPGSAINHLSVEMDDSASSNAYFGTYFDTSNGNQSGTVYWLNAVAPSFGSQVLGGGWVRPWVSSSLDTGYTTGFLGFLIANNSNDYVWPGDGTTNMYLWGAQAEQGTFPTSVIFTDGTSATRNRDNVQVSLSGLEKRAVLAEWSLAVLNTTRSATVISLSDGTSNNVLEIYVNSSGNVCCKVISGGVTQFTATGPSVTAGTVYRTVLAWNDAGDVSMVHAGAVVATASGKSIPSVTTAYYGDAAGGTTTLNGWLREVIICPQKLADSNWQTLTNLSITLSMPDIFAMVSGFVLHWTGVLVPIGTQPASAYGWEVFDKFVPDPVSSANFVTPTYDNGFDDQLRVWSATSALMGPGQAGTPDISTALDGWLTGGVDANVFTPWIIGYETLRFGRMMLTYSGIAEGNTAYLQTFNLDMDRGLNSETVDAVTIAAGGTAVTFPQPFHFTPFVTPQYTGTGAGYYATASNISSTGCTINVWNPAGSSVGGPVSYKAEGV